METEKCFLTSWTKPTQSITLLLNVWLCMKFFKERANFKQDMSDYRCDNSTRCCKELDREVGRGPKLYIDKFLSFPDLFDDLTKHKINRCGTVWPKRKGIPLDLLVQNEWPKRGEIRSRTRHDFTAMVWTDGRDMYVLTNMHNPPATEGNFCDENGNTLKPQISQGHNQHMGYVDKADRMTNSYSIRRWTWKWKKKPFFPPVNHDYCEHIPSPDIMWCRKDT
jgi:hypothetical protein